MPNGEAKYIAFADGVTITAPPIASGGGGGGGSFNWNAPGGQAPIASEENGERVFLFTDGGDEMLVGTVEVPSSYNAGSPIGMRLRWYSSATVNDVKFQTTAYLIKADVDPAEFPSVSRTSTVGATANASTANAMRATEVDLTDDDGLIGGVAVAPGDTIRVALVRDWANDTDTNDVRLVPSATGVLFE